MKTLMITGNIGRDAELRQIGNNNNYYCFPVAIESRAKDAPTDWVDVCLYAREGSKMGTVLKKGNGVFAIGRSSVRAYTGRDGQVRASETLWADSVELTKFAPANEEEAEGTAAKAGAPAAEDDDDPGTDLPF